MITLILAAGALVLCLFEVIRSGRSTSPTTYAVAMLAAAFLLGGR